MPVEQMNVSLPPKMARFIRSKVKDGQYTNASEVVRDAVRHMQEAEATMRDRAFLTDFEAHLPESQRKDILRSVLSGIDDVEAGRFDEYDDAGLRKLTGQLVADATKTRISRSRS